MFAQDSGTRFALLADTRLDPCWHRLAWIGEGSPLDELPPSWACPESGMLPRQRVLFCAAGIGCRNARNRQGKEAEMGSDNGLYRSRTDTPFRAMDFESIASANSAKRPRGVMPRGILRRNAAESSPLRRDGISQNGASGIAQKICFALESVTLYNEVSGQGFGPAVGNGAARGIQTIV